MGKSDREKFFPSTSPTYALLGDRVGWKDRGQGRGTETETKTEGEQTKLGHKIKY